MPIDTTKSTSYDLSTSFSVTFISAAHRRRRSSPDPGNLCRTTGLCDVADRQISACRVTARTESGDIRYRVSVVTAV